MKTSNYLFSIFLSGGLLLPIIFVTISVAQTPKYSNEFLSIGVGARSFGMANACVASVKDVTSGYWNPAGLSGIKSDMQFTLMHSEYFAGISKYDYVAITRRIDSSSVFGLNLIRFGVDNIPNTTELIDADGNVDYNKITQFSAADYGFLLSYSHTPKIKGLQLGGNVKIIRRIVGDFAGAWGFGLDAGVQYEYEGWKFGAMTRDITSTFNAWNFNLPDEMKNVFDMTGNEIPINSVEITLPRLILGCAEKINIDENFSLLTELNLDMTFDGKRNVLFKSNTVSADPHFGLEFGYKGIAFLRGGIMNIQKERNITGKSITTIQPNLGIGVKIKQFCIDYSTTDLGDRSGALYSHIFSIKIDINKKPLSLQYQQYNEQK
ncbi:MAG: PorV/PorQ family protein [Bacteroidota bacterium]